MARHAVTVGSDVAAFALWDGGTQRPTSISGSEFEQAVLRGDVLAVGTGGDGSYRIEIWIDEPFIAPDGQPFERVAGDIGLHLDTGAVVVDGLEFLARDDRSKPEASVKLEPGWYRAEVHVNRTPTESLEYLGSVGARRVLTADERSRYEELGSRYSRGCLAMVAGFLAALTAVVLRGWLGMALAAIALGLLSAAIVYQLRVTKGTDYLNLHDRVLRAEDDARPADFAIVLRRIQGPLPGLVVGARQTG